MCRYLRITKVLLKINKYNISTILNCIKEKNSVYDATKEFQKYANKNLKILISNRKGDMVKIIASNKKLMNFANGDQNSIVYENCKKLLNMGKETIILL